MQKVIVSPERLLARVRSKAVLFGASQSIHNSLSKSRNLSLSPVTSLRTAWRSRSYSAVVMAATTPALQPQNFPSPFHHERAIYRGGEGTLKSSAWEVLKHIPGGLTANELRKKIDSLGEYTVNDSSGIDKELEEDIYFVKAGNGRWQLSIYKPLRWGIAGTAQIAEDVVETMQLIPGVEVTAVAAGSSKEKAEAFAKEHGVKKAYGSYDDLAQDPDVDLVYISNLHTQHKDTVLTMAKAKKNILCEKPLSVNKKETQVMIDAAEEAGVFFMAGLWSRFFPAQKK